ncbi:MAG: HEAT repeat domain-containing protein, partial [Planctomycetota bacterium]|nr:HEAT repeat domain-containing protein [Planctomycetota bacterium]
SSRDEKILASPVSEEKRIKDEVGVLIESLSSHKMEERIFSARRLNELTGLFFDYNPTASEEERLEGVRRWQAWWEKAKERSPEEWLSDALMDRSYRYRAQAAYLLGRRGKKTGVRALKEGIKDEEAKVREASAFALGMLQDETALNELKILATDDEDESVRVSAANALSLLGERGWEVLAEISDRLREIPALFAAADALSALNRHQAIIQLLKRLIGTGDRLAIQYALKRIGELKISEMRPDVEKLKGSSDETTRRMAEKVSEKIGEEK